jgi:hypothetical protein
LRKKTERGYTEHVAWIPEKFAVQNRMIKIKMDGEWDDGWQVVGAGGSAMSEKYLLARERDFARQRKASDI